MVDVNGTIFNHSTDIPVNCSSTYIIYTAAVNRCSRKSVWVNVDTVSTGVCEGPRNVMAIHAGNACKLIICVRTCTHMCICVFIRTCTCTVHVQYMYVYTLYMYMCAYHACMYI